MLLENQKIKVGIEGDGNFSIEKHKLWINLRFTFEQIVTLDVLISDNLKTCQYIIPQTADLKKSKGRFHILGFTADVGV